MAIDGTVTISLRDFELLREHEQTVEECKHIIEENKRIIEENKRKEQEKTALKEELRYYENKALFTTTRISNDCIKALQSEIEILKLELEKYNSKWYLIKQLFK